MTAGAGRRPDAVLERLLALHPKIIDLSLDRVWRLLARMGHPERSLPPVIHVAGTNGKGSTLAVLRAMVEAAGRRPHVYTSPHLVRFRERIRLAGTLIAEDALTDLLEEAEGINGGENITFFEITTCAALLAFARTPADVLLLETGLGGRLDATNVVARPAATVLTPIDLDHQKFLGDTIAAIATEKAHIMKPGVPCVVARQPAEALAVIEAHAAAIGAPLLLEGRDWSVERLADDRLRFRMGGREILCPPPGLGGAHQYGNAGAALAAALAAGLDLPETALARGVAAAEWPARLQRLRRGPLAAALPEGWELWLDGGHNPSAGRVLGEALGRWHDRPLYAVCGMMADKDAVGFLAPLVPHLTAFRAIAIPGEDNGKPPADLLAAATAAGVPAAATAAGLAEAVTDLAALPGPARLLICGSLYLAGTVLADND
ncbi:folylpolyglutamate synthase/dihydrofolate synthase family protein [Caenispirillum bisanense]|uniref:bifunctional folylpolyglutamate synthase/dihydrofolate synthase n=1 Tax=Caenispirillum bisanense TaxID=414052 RepID=UPI0031D8EA50